MFVRNFGNNITDPATISNIRRVSTENRGCRSVNAGCRREKVTKGKSFYYQCNRNYLFHAFIGSSVIAGKLVSSL